MLQENKRSFGLLYCTAFILLQPFPHVQEITLQQNHVGVACANLPLSLGVLLTYLPEVIT